MNRARWGMALTHLAASAALAQSGPLSGQYKPWDQHKAVQEAQQRLAAGQDPIPGPRSCF